MTDDYAALFSALSRDNLEVIALAGGFTCFHCGTHGTSDDIQDVCGSIATGGATALCPSCGIDACIPDMTTAVLQAASDVQFGLNGMCEHAGLSDIEEV
jgi:hypothetical protein